MEMATHFSVLAWRIPGTGKPGGLPSMGLHRVGHDWSNAASAAAGGGKLGDEQSWIDVSEVKLLNRVWYFEILWTVAYQAPLSMEFSRREYWSGLPSPGDLPNLGIEPSLLHCRQMLYPEPPGKPIDVSSALCFWYFDAGWSKWRMIFTVI